MKKSSVFQYPYEKVFRSTRFSLSTLGMRIVSSDEVKGKITAVRGLSIGKPSVSVELMVERMDNQTVKVTIDKIEVKKHFFHGEVTVEENEDKILEAIAALI